jgi:hypothetical protein
MPRSPFDQTLRNPRYSGFFFDGMVLGISDAGGISAMMKAVLGLVLGGVVAGLVVLAASAQGRASDAAWAYQTQAISADATTDSVGARTVAVQCEPYQEAQLQRSFVAGREVARVACVTRLSPIPDGAPMANGYHVQSTYAQPDIVQRPVVRTQSVRPRTQRVVDEREDVRQKRSWGKSALIIGGAAGAGAGVGGLAGGKKGALIGAAIGGGGGAIYEAIKRK